VTTYIGKNNAFFGENEMNHELLEKIDGIVKTLKDLRGHL